MQRNNYLVYLQFILTKELPVGHHSMDRHCSEEVKSQVHQVLLESDRSEESIHKGKTKITHCGKIRRIRSWAVILVLFWTFAVFSASHTVFNHIALDFQFLKSLHAHNIPAVCFIAFCGPLAGWLADIKLGRYRVLYASLWLMWIGIAGLIVVITYDSNTISKRVLKPLCGVPICCGYASFVVNSIQFAIDQIPEASSEEVSAFIHWYVWVTFLGRSLSKVVVSSCLKLLVDDATGAVSLLIMLAVLTLGLCGNALF